MEVVEARASFIGPLNFKGRNESQQAYTAGSEAMNSTYLYPTLFVSILPPPLSLDGNPPLPKSPTSARKTPTSSHVADS